MDGTLYYIRRAVGNFFLQNFRKILTKIGNFRMFGKSDLLNEIQLLKEK